MDKYIHIHIGLDDTDHLESDCTTKNFNELLNYLADYIKFTILSRKLVRLWPFANRRTRGNAALSGVIEINMKDEERLYNISNDWFKKLLINISSHPPCNSPASPVLVISRYIFSEKIYWDTVKGHVDLSTRLNEIKEYECKVYAGESYWGLIGASAAISWVPNENHSYELIAWRKRSMIGKKRIIDIKTITELDRKFPKTFVNRDPTKNRGLIAPRTPCPVLYGIRGKSPEILEESHNWLQSNDAVENSTDYAIHCTNQLTDDHVIPYSGTVISKPVISRGAHASIKVILDGKLNTLVAFSQGGSVNRLLRTLEPGDIISWTGLYSPLDSSIHLEKLSLFEPVPRIISRPLCCNISMKSVGNNQGLRCIKCHSYSEKYWISKIPIMKGIDMIDNWTEPTPSNRRHLSKPLELGPPNLNNLIP
jgi:tRNA(Ile2)-agmatinylcytidine synthase